MGAKKCYIATIVILVLLCAGLLAGLLYLLLKPETVQKKITSDDDVCVTKDCALTAATLIENMDTSVNPCEDFFEFSCGGFIQKHPVSDEVISFTVDDKFFNNFELQLTKLVEEWNSFGEPDVVFRMQEAYHVCLNTTYQRHKEMVAFKNFTRNVLNWPLMIGKDWKPKYSHPRQYLSMFEEMGLHNPLVKIEVEIDSESDSENSTKYRAWLEPPVFQSLWFRGSISEDTDSEKIFKHTRLMLMKIIHHLGNTDDEAINKELRDVTLLSFYLTKATETEESEPEEEEEEVAEQENGEYEESEGEFGDNGEEEYNGNEEGVDDDGEVMTFRQLSNITAWKINWVRVVNSKMGRKAFTIDDEVMVTNTKYFEELGNIIGGKKIKNKKRLTRALINVFGLEIMINGILKHASPEIDRIINEYVSATEIFNDDALFGKEERKKPRWLFCLQTMKETFNLVLTRLFIKKYIDKDEKKSADEMIQLVLKAYRQNIENSEWLDKETKEAALRKADKIKRFVGYPDAIFDNAALDMAYRDVLPHVKSTHFENYLMSLQAKAKDQIPVADEVQHELVTWKWDSSPLEVNAFYLPHKNSIWFPYAHLQLPYFQDNRLAAVNFGMMGGVIGHEVGHAFDDHGSTRDENGRENNWWTTVTQAIYYKKSNCFIHQYSAFCPESLQGGEDKICVNGYATVGENAADNTGLEAAYVAYKSWVKERGVEKRLPGLKEYTPDQIFFISYGGSWCENILPDKWENRYDDDSHSPARYRVIGAVSNSKSFREVFNCPEGPMNRGNKSCTVW